MAQGGVLRRDQRNGAFRQSRALCAGSIGVIQAILRPLFADAVRDGYLSVNPCDRAMLEIRHFEKKRCARSSSLKRTQRKALTEQEQSVLMAFLRDSAKYRRLLPLFILFLGTGCRVGELIGLRWEDCDFQNNQISINHILIYKDIDGTGCRMHLTAPKSAAGNRSIPMLRAVRQALLMERARQEREGVCRDRIDGSVGFVFQSRSGHVYNPSALNRIMNRIRSSCNAWEQKKAAAEGRMTVLLPHFSAHSLRHTFCTRFCENETNLKLIQSIMGHADISITMNIYAEATESKKQKSMEKLEGRIPLG